MTICAQEVFLLKRWLRKGGIGTSFARWVMELLPQKWPYSITLDNQLQYIARRDFLAAAAFRGIRRVEEVRVGQVSFVTAGYIVVIIPIRTLDEAARLEAFGRKCLMTMPASILRTAAMLGLNLPRVEQGVMSCTREEPLTSTEIHEIWIEGNGQRQQRQRQVYDT